MSEIFNNVLNELSNNVECFSNEFYKNNYLTLHKLNQEDQLNYGTTYKWYWYNPDYDEDYNNE
jgi:hypothetical protein